MSEPPASASISYQTSPDPLKVRFVHWLTSQPTWRIAIGLMLFALIPYAAGLRQYLPGFFKTEIEWRAQLFLPFAALFLPAAIQQLNWRRGLLMLAFAAVASAIDLADWSGYPWRDICWEAPFAGFAWWVVHRTRTGGELARILVLCAVVACWIPTLTFFASRLVAVPIWNGGTTGISLSYVCRWLLLAPLTWNAIELAERGSQSASVLYSWKVAGALLLTSVGWFLLFFDLLAYKAARISVAYDFPIQRNQALWYLGTRRNAGDDLAIWHALESADWSHPHEDNFFEADYREKCIQMLSERDGALTANRLASLLRSRPSPILANDAAAVLEKEHRYEAAPELMRYALLDASDCPHAKEALISWGVPQAALAILRCEAEFSAMLAGAKPTRNSVIWAAKSRSDLARLLGNDAGNRLNDWINLYDSTVDKRPSPLQADTQKEVNRVVTAVSKYWITAGRLRRSGRISLVPPPNFDVPGSNAFGAEIKKFCDAADATETPEKPGANGR